MLYHQHLRTGGRRRRRYKRAIITRRRRLRFPPPAARSDRPTDRGPPSIYPLFSPPPPRLWLLFLESYYTKRRRRRTGEKLVSPEVRPPSEKGRRRRPRWRDRIVTTISPFPAPSYASKKEAVYSVQPCSISGIEKREVIYDSGRKKLLRLAVGFARL